MLEGMLEGWGGLAAAAAALVLVAGLLGARRGGSAGARQPPPASARARSGAEQVERGTARPAPEPTRSGAAAEALLRVVRDELQRGHNEAAVAHWLALGAAGLDAHADPALAIRMATLLRDLGRSEEAATALRAALRSSSDPTAVATATRVARAASDFDPGLAVDAAGRALASPELDLLDRQDLERLLAKLQGGAGIEPGEDAGVRDAADPEPAEQPAARPAATSVRPEPIELGHEPRRLEVVLATPLALEPAGLRVALERGVERVVGWGEIDAVAVGAVEGFGAKPVLVVDLVAGWRRPAEEPLRIVRLRGDRFDPRKVAPGPSSPVDALRELVDRLLAESGAAPLPDLRAARGRPFAGFRDLTAFEEDVLAAEEGGSAGKGA